MDSIVKLALALFAFVASSRRSLFGTLLGRMAAAALFLGLALLLAIAALACAGAALWIALIPQLGETGAPLVVAAICLTFSGILALVAWLLMRERRRRLGEALQVDLLLAEAGRFLNEHKDAALLAAALAGMLAARRRRKQ